MKTSTHSTKHTTNYRTAAMRRTSEYQYAIYARPSAGGEDSYGGFLTASMGLTDSPTMAVMYLTAEDAKDVAERIGLSVTGEHKTADILHFVNGR